MKMRNFIAQLFHVVVMFLDYFALNTWIKNKITAKMSIECQSDSQWRTNQHIFRSNENLILWQLYKIYQHSFREEVLYIHNVENECDWVHLGDCNKQKWSVSERAMKLNWNYMQISNRQKKNSLIFFFYFQFNYFL